jgi:ABC-type multidrug transport system fused ATPase/permease subunit
LGAAKPTLSLIDSLQETPIPTKVMDSLASGHDGFVPEIQISEVTFAYPSQVKPAIDKVSLKILPGSSVAIVGPSGAGKTTLIDVLLGVLNPDSGKVLVSGVEPLKAISKWPGAISYVPQDVLISAGTIRENVAYGFPASVASDDQVMSSLKIAHLDDFCSGLPQGIDTHVGERGALISGGQRQRLGIARAMFTRPLLIVLDEATSSLDGETESKIAATLRDLHGSTTVVVIAHRLSTLRNVDQVVYLAGGQIVSVGSFDEVRREVPDFDYQAKLMGL